MNSKLENLYFYIATILILSFYLLGFYIREISNGAGHTDLQLHIWLLVNDFEKDLSNTFKNYLSYKEATFPFFHLFQALVNPFKNKVIYYCLSNTIFNLLILFVFYYFLKKKEIFKPNENNLLILTVLIVLLSPWFRSSSYWGMTENFSLFFLIPSLFYFSKICESKIESKLNIILTISICLTIYSRQQYIFLPIAHLLILIIDKDFKKLVQSILIYFVFSIPGLAAYNVWGVFEDINNATSASSYISLKNIFYNIPKISTLFLFYLIPILILNYRRILDIFFSKKFLIIFSVIFVIEYFLFREISYPAMGGGYIIKFNIIFFNNNMIFILLLSSIFFSLLVIYRDSFNFRYYLLFILIFIIIGLPEYLYQEWFDPIYIFVYFLLLPKSMIVTNNLNQEKSIYFLLVWELSILIIAISYYHFYLNLPFFYNF